MPIRTLFDRQGGAQPSGYRLEGATPYHKGDFPPKNLDYERIVQPLGAATEALARYDALLGNLHNKELLIAPLRTTEAVISSRIEGTVATLEDVLRIQADAEDDDDPEHPADGGRSEAFEVFCYTRAMKYAQRAMEEGLPISARLIRNMHRQLLVIGGRHSDKTPGEFKTDQNYIVDPRQKQVLFIPAESGPRLDDGISALEKFINRQDIDFIIQTALAHLEFEALHPFKDGNGRVGRMLITLNLWDKKKISDPHFYISGFLEQHRDEYIDRLRRVSSDAEWTEWVIFFLNAITEQAAHNTQIAQRVSDLYDEMKEVFRKITGSQWCMKALDYIFEKAVFRNSSFTRTSGIPMQTAYRITRALVDQGLLLPIEESSGRRSALYAFHPLLTIVRG